MSSRLALIKRCSARHNAKTRAAADRRAKLDAMCEAVSRPLDNEQSKSKGLGARRVDSEKRLEYAVQLVRRNTLACIVNLDTNGRTPPSAADENAPAGQCMI
jgi:hypothetical protein